MNTIQMAGVVFYIMLSITLSSSSPLERIKRSLQAAAGYCPPGVWTCLTEERDHKMIEEPNQEDFSVGADRVARFARACPPGVWTCIHAGRLRAEKRNIKLEKMSKQRRRVQRSVKNCPPGIWMC